MRVKRESSFKEEIPEEYEQELCCFVCDKQFRNEKRFQEHREKYHDKVVIYHKSKSGEEKYDFRMSWQIDNFDDLFLLPKNQKSQKRKTNKIKKLKKASKLKKRCKGICLTNIEQ